MWGLTDHACRFCLGRVLNSFNEKGEPIVRCAECGAVGDGDHTALCCCGLQQESGIDGRRRSSGLRCTPRIPTPEVPREVVVKFMTN